MPETCLGESFKVGSDLIPNIVWKESYSTMPDKIYMMRLHIRTAPVRSASQIVYTLLHQYLQQHQTSVGKKRFVTSFEVFS